MPTEKVRTRLYFFSCNGCATAFPSLEKATVAAEEYSLDRGYPCEAFLCEKCKHYHIRQSQAPRDIPEEDRWLPSRHRARRTRVREVEAARRAEEERLLAAKEELNAQRMLRAAAKAAEWAHLRAEKEARRRAPVVKVERAPARSREEVAAERTKVERELRVQRDAANLCTACGATRTGEWKQCEACRTHNRKASERYLLRRATASPAVTHAVGSQVQQAAP